MKSIAVIGAGITGLTCAYLLINKGYRVTVFEKSDQVGGLAASFQKGALTFDYGPHVISRDNEKINELLQEILGDDLMFLTRKASQFFNHQYVNYPFRIEDVFKCFSIFNPLKIAAEGVKCRIASRLMKRDDHSFEQWVLRRYGKTLYETYFKPYTVKVWGVDPASLDATLASERIIFTSVFDLLFRNFITDTFTTNNHNFRHSPLKDTFYYCRKGIGTLARKLSEHYLEKGGEIQYQCELKHIRTADHRITHLGFSGTERVSDFDYVVSTIPITTLLNALAFSQGTSRLRYRNIIFVFVALPRRRLTPYHWIYFPGTDIAFQRMTDFAVFRATLTTDESIGVSFEISCFEDDFIWSKDDEEILEEVRQGLVRSRLLGDREPIEGWVRKVSDCYPVQFRGFNETVRELLQPVLSLRNCISTGRQGLYRYCNIHECMEMAVDAAESIDRLH